jgi:hypothetical protein
MQLEDRPSVAHSEGFDQCDHFIREQSKG